MCQNKLKKDAKCDAVKKRRLEDGAVWTLIVKGGTRMCSRVAE